MGVVSPIASLSVMVPLVYSIINGERPSTLAMAGMVIAILGAFLGSGPELKGGLSPRPIVLAVIAAFCFGTSVLLLTRGAQTNVLMTACSMRLPSFLLMALLAIRFRTFGNFQQSSIRILIFSGVFDFLANVTLGEASTLGLVSAAVVLASLYPVVTTVLAFRFSHERLHKVQYVGIVFAIAGVSLISLG